MLKILTPVLIAVLVLISVPTAYAQDNLTVGAEGPKVTLLQQALNALNKAVTPIGQETAYFGQKTAEAIKSLQCQYGLVCTGTAATTGFGRVGALTNGLLDSLLAASKNGSLAAVGAASLTTGLVADYGLTEGSGTTVKDSAQSGNGSITGATWTDGNVGKALSFTKDGDSVSIPTQTFMTSRTVSFWANPSSLRFYSIAYEDSAHDYVGVNNTGQLRVNWKNANGQSKAANITAGIQANTWQLITVTYDQSSIKVYRNGSLVSSTSYSDGLTVNPIVLIGARSGISGGGYFGGSMGEFRVYNRALTDSEVSSLYTDMSTAAPVVIQNAPSAPAGSTYVVTDVKVVPTTNGATITWNTPTPTLGSVEFGATTRLGSLFNVFGSSVSHTASFANLVPNTTYYYVLRSRSTSGVLQLSAPMATFKTLALTTTPTTPTTPTQPTTPTDTTAPVISGVTVVASSTTATVIWKTNESSDTSVEYGPTTALGSKGATPTMTLTHVQVLTNLVADTVYHYVAKSKDAAGNIATTIDQTFRTLASAIIPPPTFAGTYYVDFAGGSDTNAGTSQLAAWKHAPGDPNATGVPKSVVLAPGTTVLFKGGVRYAGSITIPASGTLSSPIVYKGDGWGTAKAIIDGSEPITNFVRCSSAADCAGNPNWANIYRAAITVPSYLNLEPEIRLNILQGDQPINPAQVPASASRYYQVSDNYYSVPASKVSKTSITDDRLVGLGGSSLVGSYVYIWGNPNAIYFEKITGYNATTHTISFASTLLYTDRDTKYAIANAANGGVFNQAGEYYFNPATNMLYVWPLSGVNLTGSSAVTMSVRSVGIDFSNRSNVTVTGFVIEKQSGDQAGEGGAVIKASSAVTSGLTVTNNEIRLMQGDGYSATAFLWLSNLTVNNNYIHDLLGDMRGFQSNGTNVTVDGNHLKNIARTGIYFAGVNHGTITNNLMEDSNSTHGNGISVYQNANDVTVAYNTVRDANIAFTMEDSSNLNIYSNLFDGANHTTNVFADWSGMTGTVRIMNNTIVGSTNNFGLHLASVGSSGTFFVQNNIIDGGGERGSNATYTNNIYTGLLFNQDAKYGWAPLPTELVSTETAVFTNAAAGDYTLKSGSPALGKGVNLSSFFGLNVLGKTRSTWNIGAY